QHERGEPVEPAEAVLGPGPSGALQDVPENESENPGEQVGTGEEMNAGGENCKHHQDGSNQRIAIARHGSAEQASEGTGNQQGAEKHNTVESHSAVDHARCQVIEP